MGDEHTVRTMRSDRVVMAAEKSLAIFEKNVWQWIEEIQGIGGRVEDKKWKS